MVFDRFNIDFTGMEACIGLSYKALGRFLLGSSSSPEKVVSAMIGSLEKSAVFSTICFRGSTIANAVERLTKSCDKRAVAGVAKAINDSKAAQRQLEELQRHNRVMEGRGVYLAPYKRGRGVNRIQSHISSTLQSEQLRTALSTVSVNG
ncbi:hypothetical protein ALC57_09354 [Trachymyrmex cornetzi]|uniref:Uncharacterized protein n=1 Tax=Trachymyrmex cornetzi TaxID=471704 RepID=A0A151J5H2_9HYME|nr:hypothetical protein ALC57_09354 [Trachymyrmex cornetzi]